MDVDALRGEVQTWVEEGIITAEQAEEILARYETADAGRSRVVVALSAVGAALVLVGLLLFLGSNWRTLPRWGRTLVLIAGPGVAYTGGVTALRRGSRRPGLALSLLGAVLLGPSLFLFVDLYDLEIATRWVLLAWAALALPTGHALESRPGTGFGLLLLVALVADVAEPTDPWPVVGLLGLGLFALGYPRSGPVAWTYRVGGAAVSLAALVGLTRAEGAFRWFDAEPSVALAVGVVAALAGAAHLRYAGERDGSRWVAIVLVAIVSSFAVAGLAPETVPALPAFLVLHLAGLVGLLATGYLGYRTRSRALVDLAALGALVQTLSFVATTVVDELSGSIALVVAGLVLLGAAHAIERGRRSVLSRL